jgi:hypothetical protein
MLQFSINLEKLITKFLGKASEIFSPTKNLDKLSIIILKIVIKNSIARKSGKLFFNKVFPKKQEN